MFALVDANSFYCSAEQVFRPDWRGKPVVVLSNNDGTAVAVNRQGREKGIPKFEPYFKIRALCEQMNAIVVSSNYELYSHLSSQMMEVIGRFAPTQYVYSIDESFLDFNRTSLAIPDYREHGLKIRKAVWRECRLPVCVGFGETLTLAKLANHEAKKNRDYGGVCVIDTVQRRRDILAKTKVGDVWSIGSKLSSRMKFMGINTALDLAQYDATRARKAFNINVERTIRELNGQRCLQWDSHITKKKQIFSTRSVGQRITDIQSLTEAIAKHAAIVAKKARAQQSLCKTMVVFAGNSPFDEKPHSRRVIHEFDYASSDTIHLTQTATRMARSIFVDGVQYYKIGVGLIELVEGKHEQRDLFNETPTNHDLMHVLDNLNSKYGTDTVFLGAQGIVQKWSMRRDLLTPAYTTDWRSLPKVKC